MNNNTNLNGNIPVRNLHLKTVAEILHYCIATSFVFLSIVILFVTLFSLTFLFQLQQMSAITYEYLLLGIVLSIVSMLQFGWSLTLTIQWFFGPYFLCQIGTFVIFHKEFIQENPKPAHLDQVSASAIHLTIFLQGFWIFHSVILGMSSFWVYWLTNGGRKVRSVLRNVPPQNHTAAVPAPNNNNPTVQQNQAAVGANQAGNHNTNATATVAPMTTVTGTMAGSVANASVAGDQDEQDDISTSGIQIDEQSTSVETKEYQIVRPEDRNRCAIVLKYLNDSIISLGLIILLLESMNTATFFISSLSPSNIRQLTAVSFTTLMILRCFMYSLGIWTPIFVIIIETLLRNSVHDIRSRRIARFLVSLSLMLAILGSTGFISSVFVLGRVFGDTLNLESYGSYSFVIMLELVCASVALFYKCSLFLTFFIRPSLFLS